MAKKAAPKAAEKASAPEKPEKSAPKKKAEAAAPAPPAPKAKPLTKAEVYALLAEKTGLSKKQVSEFFGALSDVIGKELTNKKGSGVFVMPGLLKLKVVRKPATKEKQSINPFTKEPMTVKAKPARNVVKALPMKGLKGLV